jgi:catalase
MLVDWPDPGRPVSKSEALHLHGSRYIGLRTRFYDDDDDFVQPGALYRKVMSDTDREHLVANIVGHASDDVGEQMQLRVIAYWTKVDPQLGARVAAGLGHGTGSSDGQASDLVAARANRA